MPMSLELNPKCQARLVEALADQLQDVRVEKGVYLVIRSLKRIADSEKILPRTQKWQDTLNKYIRDYYPLHIFVIETLDRDIEESGQYERESESTPLSSLHSYADLNTIARRLVEVFNSLPWKYIVSFELDSALGKMLREHASDYAI